MPAAQRSAPALSIQPAARKKGVLLFIPGGPGVGIGGVFGPLRGLQHVDDFARQYDVVSFDPRGIGHSSPVRCDPNAVPPASEPIYRAPLSRASHGSC